LARRIKALPFRAYVGAALSALLVGIGVNALLLQRERHPAPLFAPPPILPAMSTQAPQLANAARGESAPRPVPPSPRPAANGDAASSPRTTNLGASLPRTPDSIAELLRGELRPDGARLIFAAQSALAKLGYPVRADGNEGNATQQAILDFERARGLPLTAEITPRLVRQLTAAAREAGR
jgi:hypothetical protein